MTKAGERLRKSMEDALAFLNGDKMRARVTTLDVNPYDVRSVRRATRLTQADFAAWLRVDVRTLRDWESGRAGPQGSVRTLLEVVARNPGLVRQRVAAE